MSILITEINQNFDGIWQTTFHSYSGDKEEILKKVSRAFLLNGYIYMVSDKDEHKFLKPKEE